MTTIPVLTKIERIPCSANHLEIEQHAASPHSLFPERLTLYPMGT